MPQFVDLHSHSTASDGTFPPREVVRLARDAGLVGLALTDHDTINGLAQAADEAASLGITFVPGIEISAVPPIENGTLHILGLCIDPQDPVLLDMARQLIQARENRNPQIIEALQKLGIDVTMDQWRAKAQGGVLGRPHLAALLVEKGVVKTFKDDFYQYLGLGGRAYFDKERLPPRDGVARI
jgi:predicted metal-dependent phosphoesterase TrpH